MEHRQKYVLVFMITFYVGYLLRFLVAGWYMVILFIPEYLFRSIYYFTGTAFFKYDLNKKSMSLNVSLQVFYLLTSFFAYDGGDGDTYTFAQFWVNPPDVILYLWALFALITCILIVKSILFLKQSKDSVKFQDNSLRKFIVGCIIIPGLAMLSVSLLSDLKLIH